MTNDERREALRLLLESFISDYTENKGTRSLNEWLAGKLKEHLPAKTDEELSTVSNDIIRSLVVQEEKKKSLADFTAQGRSKESWLAGELKRDTEGMTENERDEYLRAVNDSVTQTRADLVNLIKDSDTEPLTPESAQPITNDYQAKASALDTAKKAADNATINIILSSEAVEAIAGTYHLKGSQVIADELTSGNNTGLKAAAAGAVYAGAEREVIDMPRDYRAELSSASAFQGIETASIMADDEPVIEKVERLERLGLSVCAGISSAVKGAKKGAEAGAKIGSAFGWIGSAVGGFVGGVVGGVAGYFAGSRTSDAIVGGIKKVRPKMIERVVSTVKNVARTAWEGVKSIGRTVMGWLGF